MRKLRLPNSILLELSFPPSDIELESRGWVWDLERQEWWAWPTDSRELFLRRLVTDWISTIQGNNP